MKWFLTYLRKIEITVKILSLLEMLEMKPRGKLTNKLMLLMFLLKTCLLIQNAKIKSVDGEMLCVSINNLWDKIVEVISKSREFVDKLVDFTSFNEKLFKDQKVVCGEW